MILRLTQKLSARLKTGKLQQYDAATEPFEEWYGHLFSIGKYDFYLLTEAHTLFSCIVPPEDIDSVNSFHGISQIYIFKALMAIDCEELMSKCINPHIKTVEVYKTNNRGILGSMNDMIYQSQLYLTEYNCDIYETSRRLNITPWGYIKNETPERILTNYL